MAAKTKRGGVKGRRFRQRAPMRPTDDRYKFWRSMRVLTRSQGSFTRAEILTVTGGNYTNLESYIRGLTRAGYIVKAGTQGRYALYALVRDTGPHPPRVQQFTWEVFDLNLAGEGNDVRSDRK
jgi:hypothetical protein